MKVTGILSISNGAGLRYPYLVVLANLSLLCDDVIVGVDSNYPLDRETISALGLPNVSMVDEVWNRKNHDGGTEIALRMDRLVYMADRSRSDWVVVLQADEVFHEKDFPMLRAFMERHLDGPVDSFVTERVYFWKDLTTIRKDWNADLVRIFKPSKRSFRAEGTSKDGMFSGRIAPGEDVALPYKIYHYSRVDSDPINISRRVRNLDGFFHPDESLMSPDELPPYEFVARTHDNFSKDGFPEEVRGEFVEYTGTHPVGVQEWFSD